MSGPQSGCYAVSLMDCLAQSRELAARGELGKAIDVLEQAVALGDETAELYKELARLCLSVNEIRAFANYCHEALRIQPSDGQPHLMMSRVLCEKKRWAEAVEALDQALAAGSLTLEEQEECASLLAVARRNEEEWERRNPGFSPLAGN